MSRPLAVALCLLVASGTAAAASVPVDCPDGANDALGKAAKVRVADQHYRRGQELYAAGEYEASIPEFRAAYCTIPVPEAVFNMAQAYERLVDYEKAVALFETYIKMLPAGDKEEALTVGNRVKALRRLPARLRVTTDPPGAKLRLVGPSGKMDGTANAEPLRVSAGTYQLHVELPGYLPIEEQIVAEIGQPYTYSYRMAPETGLLRILTNPSDARIFVDDKVAGVGSYVDRLPVGQHAVAVESPDRPTERRTVMVTPQNERRMFIEMRPARPPNGKIELLLGSTAISLVEGGLLTAAFSDNKPLIAVSSAAFGAAGFLVPYLFMPGEVPTSQSSLIIGGSLWGALEAATFAATIFPGNAFEEHDEETAVLIFASSIGFGIGAGFLARNLDISAGDAAIINSGAIWGTALGIQAFASFASTDNGLSGPLTLASLNVGLLVGAILAKQTELSRSHVLLIDLGGTAGVVSGLALSQLLQDTDHSARYALVGTAVGLTVGAVLTRNLDSDTRVIPAPGFTTDAGGRPVSLLTLSGKF